MPNIAALDPTTLENLRSLQCEEDPTFLNSLLQLFITTAQERIARLSVAIPQGQAQAIHMEAHTLKSSCGNIGATAMSSICSQLEETGRQAVLAKAPGQFLALKHEFERVQAAISALPEMQPRKAP